MEADELEGLVDLARLNDWLEGQDVPGSGPVTGGRELAGGLQNNVFLLKRGNADLVLRRPGKHIRPKSNETMLSVADGPTEVNQVQIANALLKQTAPAPGLFPSEHIPTKTIAAEANYAPMLAEIEQELGLA